MFDKSRAHLFSHFIGWRADTRPDPRQHVVALYTQLCQRLFQYTVRQAAPARMSGGNFASIDGTKKHRQTIRREDRQHGAGQMRYRGIRLRLVLAGQWTQFDNDSAMHLM